MPLDVAPTSPPQLPSHLGSFNTIALPEVDLEKLEPFIGPLTPQQPPPSKPLPIVPTPSPTLKTTTSRRLYNNSLLLDANMADDKKVKMENTSAVTLPPPTRGPLEFTTPVKQHLFSGGFKDKNSIDAEEVRKSIIEGRTSNAERRILHTKVSKLFGDEPIPRAADVNKGPAPLQAYRPISLNSQESEGFSLSGIFDDVYNAGRKSAADSDRSGRPSVDLSVTSASSALFREDRDDSPTLDVYDSVSASFASGRPSISGSFQVSAAPTGRSSSSAPCREAVGNFLTADLQDPFHTSFEPSRPSIPGQSSRISNEFNPESDSTLDPSQRVLDGRWSSQSNQECTHPMSADSRDEVAASLATRLGLPDEVSRKAILNAFTTIVPPPLTEHPHIRGDLKLQGRLGMIDYHSANNAACTIHLPKGTLASLIARSPGSGFHVPPLNVSRQRTVNMESGQHPAQVAISTRNAARLTPVAIDPHTGFVTRSLAKVPDIADGQDPETDVDASPAFDRTVDVVWHRYSMKTSETHRVGLLPYVDSCFYHVTSYFTAKCARGRATDKYDQLRGRFPYFKLEPSIRFKVMIKLLEEHFPGKPILLNRKDEAVPAWPSDEFVRLWDVLGPLQNYLGACPRLHADVMVALFMTQPFHVIFSPFVKAETSPLAIKWLFKYLCFMQDVRVELDMTKLGFGADWESSAMSTKLWATGNLVYVFVEEMLKRDGRRNPLGQLTIHCRRYFGYRQGKNPFDGNKEVYKYPLVHGEDGEKASSYAGGQPWNFGRKSTSLPPSSNNPWSGHRRHHTYSPERVPYAHEGHMSIADRFTKLAGRVWSVRMCGLSEDWVRDNHAKFWPKAEFDAIDDHRIHLDRHQPSKHKYVAPGNAVYYDYGIRSGVHRFPPLPDSEPMACTLYDENNDCFTEVDSGNILTVFKNGVEIIARVKNFAMPRSEFAIPGGPAIPIDDLGRMAASRISGRAREMSSSAVRDMRRGTPRKALQLLGLPSSGESTAKASPNDCSAGEDSDDDDLATPTRPQLGTASLCPSSGLMEAVDDQLGELLCQRSLSSLGNTHASRPRALSSKKSFLSMMGADRCRPTK